MCFLVIVCFTFKVNPDNVATPIAASLGDLMMLVVLALVSTGLCLTNGMSAPMAPRGQRAGHGLRGSRRAEPDWLIPQTRT